MHTKKTPVEAEMATSHRKALDMVKGEVQKCLPYAKIRYSPMPSDKTMNVSVLLKATAQSKIVDGFLKDERTIIEDIVSKTSEGLEVDINVSIERAAATTQQQTNPQTSNILLSIAASSNASVDVTSGGRSTAARLIAPKAPKETWVRVEKPEEFSAYLSDFTLGTDGDEREKEFVKQNLKCKFHKYERMWQLAVIPATQRIEFYPAAASTDFRLRTAVDEGVREMAQFHYSVMRSVVSAVRHRNSGSDCVVQDVLMHLVNACEQVQFFLLRWFVHVEPAGKWSDFEKEEILYSTKKITETISKFLDDKAWHEFHGVHSQIERARDVLLHGPELGRIIAEGQTFVPSLGALSKDFDTSWNSLYAATDDEIRQDFVKVERLLDSSIDQVTDKVSELWRILIPKFEERFANDGGLREEYAIFK